MPEYKGYKDLIVYQKSYSLAMEIFEITKSFPREERYSLTDQIRRSSRAVPANISSAWVKRKYPKSFISKLSDSEAEAAETQVWLDFSFKCSYIDKETYDKLFEYYDNIIGKLVNMSLQPEKWIY